MHMTARSIAARSASRSRDAIEQIPCPRCGAKPGKHCKTSGGWKTSPHLERRAAAQNAGTWNPPEDQMPDRHATPLLGWHPPAELAEWVRAEAERRSVAEGRRVTVTTVLNEAILAAIVKEAVQAKARSEGN